jgi:hypothetical protein
MATTEQVGVTAGEVWHVLKDSGPLTVAQLKKKLSGSDDLVNFSLGWLAREGKIDISPEKKTFKVALK